MKTPYAGRQAKFLLMSNMRTGSTWLITMLGALPDTVTDYELKWKVDYVPQDVHYVLDELSPTVSDILDGLADGAAVLGSKFVFDPVKLTSAEFLKLRSKLDAEVRVVHLVRRYRDIFLSRRRGALHRFNESSSWRLGKHFRTALDVRPEDLCLPMAAPACVSRAACFKELKIYLKNDVWISSMRETGVQYLKVSYETLRAKMPEVVSFIGSTATPDQISAVVRAPVTLKLPEVTPAQLVENIAELDPLFEEFERLRERLTGGIATEPARAPR